MQVLSMVIVDPAEPMRNTELCYLLAAFVQLHQFREKDLEAGNVLD